jgi:hypothetical protein
MSSGGRHHRVLMTFRSWLTSSPRLPAAASRFFRAVLAAAALYHLGFAAVAVVRPSVLRRSSGIDAPAAMIAALAVVVALLGLAYAYAAARIEHARPIVLLGLACKIPPPLAVAILVWHGALPASAIALTVVDDVIWWLPFALFLVRR